MKNSKSSNKALFPIAAVAIASLGLVACDHRPATIELRSNGNSGYQEAAPDTLYKELALTADVPKPLATMELSEFQVCQGVSYRDAKGAKKTGTRPCQGASDCTASTATGCKATGTYMAVDKKAIDYSQIVAGTTFLGETGTFDVTRKPDCEATNASECVSTAEYLPISKALMNPKNFKKGEPIAAGLVGTYPSASAPFTRPAGSSRSLAQTGVSAAAAKSLEYYFWDAEGNPHKVKGDSKLVSMHIMPGHEVYGVKAGAPVPTAKPCVQQGVSECKAGSAWKAIKDSELSAANIRKDITIGKVTGNYPSASSPLKGSRPTVADLDMSTYDQLKKASPFEFFDRQGNRYEKSGSAGILPGHIKKDVPLFGVTGTFGGARLTDLNRWDLRSGNGRQVPGNVESHLKAAMFNLEIWCQNNEQFNCFHRHWQDITGKIKNNYDKCEAGRETCVFRNFVQMTDWAFPLKKDATTWADAIATCENMKLYEKDDWRVPTQKEMMLSASNSMVELGLYTTAHFKNNSIKPKFWTSTGLYPKPSSGPISRFIFDTKTENIATAPTDSDTLLNVMCIRDLEPAEAADAKANR